MISPLSKNHLKFLVKLKQKKFRDSEELFLVSGLRAAQGILEEHSDSVAEVIFSSEKAAQADTLLAEKMEQFQVRYTTPAEFGRLADEKTPQGICLVVKKPDTTFSISKTAHFMLFLDRINDPGNLGTIIRSAAWFGFKKIFLSKDSTDPFQPKVVRSSAGSLLNIRIAENVDSGQLLQLKKQKGCHLLAADVHGGHNIARYTIPGNSIIMLGSEAHGLDAHYLDLADEKISIARIGKGESLNLANAASIFMYQAAISNH